MTQTDIKKFLHELNQLSKAESIPCIGGCSDLPTQPGLQVKGRHISLPVNREELEWLCEQGEESPFGKGMDTILDADIRRSIEFEAQDTVLLNPHWKPAMDQLVNSVAEQMGIDFPVKAELYKLLVYREGGHFKFHQDTEKAPGMFATLIVQLPSRCKGGSLVCRFSNNEYHFDFGNREADSEFFVYYAAHYADVHHQVEEIAEGARLALIYNLIQPDTERKLSANHHGQLLDSVKDMVAPVFSQLSQEQHAFLLQHEYTEKSLSDLGFLAMKGQDRDLMTALLVVNEHLPLEKKLHFMISRVSYFVTSNGCGGGYYDDDDGIEWEEIEASDPCCDLCFDEDGQKIPADNFTIDWIHDLSGEEICSTSFETIDEDFWGEGDEDIEGYMGNYGPTKETTYARYLLAVMPAYPDKSEGLFQGAAFQAYRVSSMAQDLRKHPDCHWLRERFEQALKEVVTQFKSVVGQKEETYHWLRGVDKTREAVFATLIKTAIDMDDHHLCQTLVITAREYLISDLSSEFRAENMLGLLKEAINQFGWKDLSAAYTPILTGLPGSSSLKTSVALAENRTDSEMRSQLIDICVNAVCGEKDSWGEQCSFKDTILPLAVHLCKTCWYAPGKSKDLFLATCLEKGEEHPSFLSALIQKLIDNKQADDKVWLLQALITARLHYLEDELRKEPKEFSWSMPNASVRKNTITAFLQSENQQTQITGYDGIAMARKDVVSVEPTWILPEFYMESNADFLQPKGNHGFSASMQAKGRGKNACVEIKKDKRYYELCLKLRQLREQEYKRLQKIVETGLDERCVR
jgi:hypothetical protein